MGSGDEGSKLGCRGPPVTVEKNACRQTATHRLFGRPLTLVSLVCGALQMNTTFLLMAQYDAKAIIPIDVVARDYFPHLTTANLVLKSAAVEIKLPLVLM